MSESPWLAEVRRWLGTRPDIMGWRQHAGTFCPPNHPTTRVKVAPDGIGDIMCTQLRRVAGPNIRVMEIVNPDSMQPLERETEWYYGQSCAIETKARGKKQRESQEDFEDAFLSVGGVYIVAHEGQWEPLYATFGEQPDPACAGKWQELWERLKREREAEREKRREA